MMTNHIVISVRSVYPLLLSLCLNVYSVSSRDSPSGAIVTEALRQGVGSSSSLLRNANASPDSLEHRVILHPGRWKIRASDTSSVYFVYNFILGFNWTKLEVDYPECSQVACRGLPDSHKGCAELCFSDTWRDATVTLTTAILEYNRAMSVLDAAFNDLAALMNTQIIHQHWSASDPVAKLLSHHGKVSSSEHHVVDVMRYYRALIDEALGNVVKHFPGARLSEKFKDVNPHASLNVESPLDSQLVSGLKGTSRLNILLDTWKSGAFKLAVHLNAVTFAFHRAHQRLNSCAQGVQRADMTGCEPGFIEEFYTDIPVASRSQSSSRLVMVVKRDIWNPVVLSRWYMPFIDSSKGNRTCWLDRPMVSDTQFNYRVPICDSRGVCEPLEVDDETMSACEVNENGELSMGCPVVCDHPCFGPVCYQSQSETYTLKTASSEVRVANGTSYMSLIRTPTSPRILSNVHYLSDVDINASLVTLRNQSLRASQLLQRGETMLQKIITMDATARKYVVEMSAETAAQEQGVKWLDCESMIGHSHFMAAFSVTLSALTCPLLIILVIKITISRENPCVRVRTKGSVVENLI